MIKKITNAAFLLSCLLLVSCSPKQDIVSAQDTAIQEEETTAKNTESQDEFLEECDGVALEAEYVDEGAEDASPDRTEGAADLEEGCADDVEVVVEDDPVSIRCYAKVEMKKKQSVATSASPSIEEATDSSIYLACHNVCAGEMASALENMMEDAIEEALEECAENCTSMAKVLGVSCVFQGKEIYSEGIWSPTRDERATNGAEEI